MQWHQLNHMQTIGSSLETDNHINASSPVAERGFAGGGGAQGWEEMRALHQIRDPQEQCRDLLALLHASENPVTYIKLYDAIKDEPHLQWLTDRIDACSDHSEQQQTSDQTCQCQSISQIRCNKF